jgi:hypothetical protein
MITETTGAYMKDEKAKLLRSVIVNRERVQKFYQSLPNYNPLGEDNNHQNFLDILKAGEIKFLEWSARRKRKTI